MPRPPPLTLISIPQVERRQPLPQKHDHAGLLGFSKLPANVAGELAHNIALARVTRSAVKGLTRQREVAELKRCAKKLRREQRIGRPDTHLRQLLTNPRLGLRTETIERLAPLTAAPTSVLLAAVEACRRDVERLPRVNPQREARESAGATAVWIFLVRAADDVRNEPGAWWPFVLAFLDDASFPTEKLYQHPENLRPLLEECVRALGPLADEVRRGALEGEIMDLPMRRPLKMDPMIYYVTNVGLKDIRAVWWSYVVFPSEAFRTA
jgi:hypothetical protein